MLMTKRKPVFAGEVLIAGFMEPLGLTQTALAKAMGVPRKHVNELCVGRRSVSAPTTLISARVLGTSPEFWLNLQRRSEIWNAMRSQCERKSVDPAKPLAAGV
jgi:addiction module HigA family antidote